MKRPKKYGVTKLKKEEIPKTERSPSAITIPGGEMGLDLGDS